MKTLLTILALVLTVVVWSGSARAEEAPAAPATGAGIKALPGTVQKDVTDAVKHDLGAAVGAPAANAPAKGAVGTEPVGRRFLYTPLLERADYVGGESRRLVDRLFGGRAAPLFAHLAESEALSDDDIAEIERLLREMRK